MWIFTKAIKNILGKSQTSDDFTPLIYQNATPFENTYSSAELLKMYRGWVFACWDVIGDAVASLEKNVYWSDQRKDRLKKHEYLKLLDSQTIKYIAIMLKLIWAVYIYKEKVGNKVVSLTMLHSPLVQEVIEDFWRTSYYIYHDGANYYKFNKEDLVVIKTFNPVFHRKGHQVNNSWMTPLKAACVQVAMDLSSVEFNNIFFKNGARPGTVLSHEKKIDDAERAKYLRGFKEQFGGLSNSFKTIFIDQGIKLDNFSINQKDMEFTEQRRFTMDEILMMFRVPKPLLWKSDWVWFADRWVPEYYFMKHNIHPLTKLIADAFNKSLFEGKEYFEFGYVDVGHMIQEFKDGVISINEYRIATWRQPIIWGDVLWDWTDATLADVTKSSKFQEAIWEAVTKSLEKQAKKLVFWTDEYNQDIWEQKIARTDKQEEKMTKIQRIIWKEQEKDILKNIGNWKSVKKVDKEDDLFDEKKYTVMYATLYTKFFTDFMDEEWKIAMSEITDEQFEIAKLNSFIGKNIDRMSKDLDKTTKKEMFEIIKEGNRSGDGVAPIKRAISAKFNIYAKTGDKGRIDKIVRTEITRASNESQDEAYKQSWLVEQKEWFTALDERVSNECQVLHGLRVDVWWIFLKKWDKDPLGNKITYETIKHPPRHPRCRCTLRPIISEKGMKKVKQILEVNGKTYGK